MPVNFRIGGCNKSPTDKNIAQKIHSIIILQKVFEWILLFFGAIFCAICYLNLFLLQPQASIIAFQALCMPPLLEVVITVLGRKADGRGKEIPDIWYRFHTNHGDAR